MSQAYASYFLHFVWTTEGRMPYLSNSIRRRVHLYIEKIIEDEGVEVLAVGGVDDHVHVLIRMNPTDNVSRLVRRIKTLSSKFAKKIGKGNQNFAWQNGYGIFSTSASVLNKVRKYIRNQEEHHKRFKLAEEIRNIENEW